MSARGAKDRGDRRHGLAVVPDGTSVGESRLAEGRRWDDRPGELATMTFAHFLTQRPSPDEAVRLLVALLCWPIGAQGALIVKTTPAGTRVVASYVDQVPNVGSATTSGVLPPAVEQIVRTAATAQPVLWTSPDDVDEAPMAAWLLGPSHDPAGVLVVFLSTPLAGRLVSMRANSIAEILGLYLIGAGSDVGGSSGRPSSADLGTESLTARQLGILQMMAHGLTNPQIASRIGFSTSTVRMESLAIYRGLGVHDRQNAVLAARALGLLDPA